MPGQSRPTLILHYILYYNIRYLTSIIPPEVSISYSIFSILLNINYTLLPPDRLPNFALGKHDRPTHIPKLGVLINRPNHSSAGLSVNWLQDL